MARTILPATPPRPPNLISTPALVIVFILVILLGLHGVSPHKAMTLISTVSIGTAEVLRRLRTCSSEPGLEGRQG